MSREEIHSRITEILELIDINHNRLVLNQSSFDLDLAQLRSLVINLYTELDHLERSEFSVEADAQESPVDKPVTEAPKPKVFVPVVEEPIEEPVVEKPIHSEEAVEEVEVREPAQTPPTDSDKKSTDENNDSPAENKSTTKKSKGDGDVFSQLRRRRLESIKKGIGIGKRYEIQNELFNNDPEKYNAAISRLDSADSFELAEAILLDELAVEQRWDPEHPLLEELHLLLERRYI